MLGIARPEYGPTKTWALTDEYRTLIERAGFLREDKSQSSET